MIVQLKMKILLLKMTIYRGTFWVGPGGLRCTRHSPQPLACSRASASRWWLTCTTSMSASLMDTYRPCLLAVAISG